MLMKQKNRHPVESGGGFFMPDELCCL